MGTHSDTTILHERTCYTNEICADGICCFMSIPRNQGHLGKWKYFLKRRNASYGIKLLYTTHEARDIIYNPCRCLNFFLKEVSTPNGNQLQILARCAAFDKRLRPYACGAFPDKADSFMHDVSAPCIYNEYLAPENYVALKHKHVFRLFYAIKDNTVLLQKIAPDYTVEEIRQKLNQNKDIVKIGAIWNEKKPAEYFLIEVPKVDTVLHTSRTHPKIESVKQAYDRWNGHIETWLERHYKNRWHK